MKNRYYIYLLLVALIIGIITILPVNFIKMEAEEINLENLLVEGKNDYYNGYLQNSREKFNLILKEDKNNITAIKNLIIINKELGNMEEVLTNYKKLITIEDNNISLMYKYGISLYQYCRTNEAKEILYKIVNEKEIIKLTDYEISLIYYYLGEIFSDLGDYKKAIKNYERGIKKYSYNILNYLGEADIYYQQNNFKEALNKYKDVLKADSSLSHLYPKIAECYEKTSNLNLAYFYWQKSIASGIEVSYAKEKLNSMIERYPDLRKENKTERKINTDVEWENLYKINENMEIPILRIGLLDDISQIIFKSKNNFSIINIENNQEIIKGMGNELWKIKTDNGYYLFYKDNNLKDRIKIKNILIKTEQFAIFNVSYGEGYFWAGSENRQYRGKIELNMNEKGNFTLINIVNTEEYLFSVVPSEIPSWWPIEAIKAQGVAARSYALKMKEINRHKLYDLCDGVHCAVYRGINVENKVTRKAVMETSGEVITYDNKLINAVFSSNSGGYSESSKDIWGGRVEYLKGKSNIKNSEIVFPLTPYELYNWVLEKGITAYYSQFSGSNTYRWVKILPAEYFVKRYNLSLLKNITVLKRSKGGSIKEIIIEGKKKKVAIKGDNIRSGLGGLKSNRFFVNKIYNSDGNIKEVIIHGSGWGHAVGLDQTAAAGMAENGLGYKKILSHFYFNTEMKKIY